MPFILPANSLTGGYDVDNSLRFNSASADYISKTYGTPTSTQKWTASFWMKRSELGREQHIFGGTSPAQCYFVSNDTLRFSDSTAGTNYYTTQVFRDISAWYHFVIAVDTTLGTAGDRARIYVNGSEITSFGTETNATQNNNSAYNVASTSYAIGRYNPSQSQNYYFGGYYSEICFIDGSQLAADSFGEFDGDSGIWKPIDVSGLTFGNNGYYLEFKQAGTGTNSSGMGADTSGNDNHFAVNNLTAIDQSTDTCTNNFATLNPLNYSSASKTYSFGNTLITAPVNTWNATQNNIYVRSGKWYMEIKITAVGNYSAIGVGFNPFNSNASAWLGSTYLVGEDAGSYGWRNNGARPQGGTALSTYTTNDILMIAMDMDNLKVYFGKNGTWETSGDPTSGATGTGSIGNLTAGEDYLFVVSPRGGATSVNFGNPSYAISSGNTDANDYGNFEYAVPSGYYALNTKNLAEFG